MYLKKKSRHNLFYDYMLKKSAQLIHKYKYLTWLIKRALKVKDSAFLFVLRSNQSFPGVLSLSIFMCFI